MKRAFTLLFLFISLTSPALAQRPAGARQLLLVVPFENKSKAPGLDWIGEAFAEMLSQRMSAGQVLSIDRRDRLYAFDRLGLPANIQPSLATLFRIAQEMDVDQIVVGSYTYDGRNFTARCQLMDLRKMRITPEIVEGGALTQLVEIQNAIAWGLLRTLDTQFPVAKNQFTASLPAVRLDALENYVRGLIATSKPDKVRYLKEAVRVSPDYTDALLSLGHTYFEAKEYDNAIAALEKIAEPLPQSNEANFYIGLAAYYNGRFERAEEAFKKVAAKLPLTEVYNNLGVVMARRGKKAAIDHFQRASLADARDADYRFNLGVAQWRGGDNAGAQKSLREAVGLNPQDGEAKALLEAAQANAAMPRARERIKRNYDESSYRQLALEIYNVMEQRYNTLSKPEHAALHVNRGNEMLLQELNDQAEGEFREAVLLDPTNAGAHIGLARVLERDNQLPEARAEANVAVRMGAGAEALLVLARVEIKNKQLDLARSYLDRALRADPNNQEAREVQKLLQESDPRP